MVLGLECTRGRVPHIYKVLFGGLLVDAIFILYVVMNNAIICNSSEIVIISYYYQLN